MSEVETRHHRGVTQHLIHRINGESAWLDSADARRTVNDHSDEWAFRPFSAAQQKAAQRDMPLDPALVNHGA